MLKWFTENTKGATTQCKVHTTEDANTEVCTMCSCRTKKQIPKKVSIHTCIQCMPYIHALEKEDFPRHHTKTAKRSTQFSAQWLTGCADYALHTAEKQILMKVNECSWASTAAWQLWVFIFQNTDGAVGPSVSIGCFPLGTGRRWWKVFTEDC